MTGEGVSLNLGCWIGIGWRRSDRRGRERTWSPEQDRARWISMDGGEELTDVRSLGPTGHRLAWGKFGEQVGKMANSSRVLDGVAMAR